MLAVKRLKDNTPVKTFYTEVANLMAFKHENIVQLVGFCHEPQKNVIPRDGRYVIVEMTESCLCIRIST